MAEGQVLIKDLLEATEVDDSAYLPIDDGELTKKISVENFNASSNQTAKAYAEAAAASAQTASDTVANINQKVDQAQGYANAAQTQAGYASTYADNAQTYAGNAQGYANTASGHATNAGASASAASASADASANNAVLAKSWAEGNTGAREGENTNNARYWANKAQSAAQITIDDHLDPQSTNPVENRAIYEAINAIHTGGSTIEIVTAESALYGKEVTLTAGSQIYTATFNGYGVATISGITNVGDITITSTDGTDTAGITFTIPYYSKYRVNLNFWTATVNLTTSSSELYGSVISVYKDNTKIGETSFSSEGVCIYKAKAAGTYVFSVIYNGQEYSASLNITEETVYTATIDTWTARINITTPNSQLYGKTITVTKGGELVGTTDFSNSGEALFIVHEAGTYTFSADY